MASNFDVTIPVLSLDDYYDESRHELFVEELSNALQEVGFFAITGSDIDPEVLDGSYEAIKTFFSLPLSQKMKARDPQYSGERGYVMSEIAKGQTEKDYKEFYHIARDHEDLWPNIWPDFMDLENPMMDLYHELDRQAIPIARALAEAIGQDRDYFYEMIENGDCLMRPIHYPASPPSDAIWAAAHTDIDLFTILPRATARGLQVCDKNGEWIDVIVPDGAFIINAGDMLENTTNGLFRSSLHRVVDSGENAERFSIVFFVHGRAEDPMSPLPQCIKRTGGIAKFAEATRWELLMERLTDLDLASDEMLRELADSGLMERLIELGRASPDAMRRLKEAGYASEAVLNELDKG